MAEGPSTSGGRAAPEMASCNNNGVRRPLKLNCIGKIQGIPLFDKAISTVGGYYNRFKRINPVTEWGLDVAEEKLYSVAEFSLASPLKFPLKMADSVFCYSLGLVENRIPVIKRQPDEIIPTVRKMVSDKAEAITHPVVSRASSFKKVATKFGMQKADQAIGTRVGSITANKIIAACQIAENLMDTYLPDPEDAQRDAGSEDEELDHQSAARYTVGRVDNVTRTFGRRLAKRTCSLKKSIMDTIYNLLSFVKSIVTNPKSVWDYMANIWYELSEDEPENQPPPKSLSEVTGVIVRESARQVVHVVNALTAWPIAALKWFAHLINRFYKSVRLDQAVAFANKQLSAVSNECEMYIQRAIGRFPQ
ncbi:Hypothetical predicted protein [Cloeon dipterum]|uniref:Lipid storage droplets surface-binding protein 1 n=1 Tax=Cloeon dipterum TaxID=197152 RepID=A0A8S1DQY3_9INSE|nr:Hypothetical predicted protein [Cloeon dipterum]